MAMLTETKLVNSLNHKVEGSVQLGALISKVMAELMWGIGMGPLILEFLVSFLILFNT